MNRNLDIHNHEGKNELHRLVALSMKSGVGSGPEANDTLPARRASVGIRSRENYRSSTELADRGESVHYLALPPPHKTLSSDSEDRH